MSKAQLRKCSCIKQAQAAHSLTACPLWPLHRTPSSLFLLQSRNIKRASKTFAGNFTSTRFNLGDDARADNTLDKHNKQSYGSKTSKRGFKSRQVNDSQTAFLTMNMRLHLGDA